MNSKLLLICGLILLSSCTQNKFSKTGEIETIEKQFIALNKSQNTRVLAQTQEDVCLSDALNESRLMEEIRALENTKSIGSKLIINGLDLSRFPSSQSVYLEKNREWIYTQNLNLAECTDIKCLFTKIYPNSNGMEGYLNYYFYLQTGYALSTVNSIPDIALGSTVTFQDTLFSQEELNSFYQLSKSLSSTFHKIPTLSSFHRMPKNMFMPAYGQNACGLAGGALNKGYVILMDNCLTRSSESLLGGNFFPLVTHEISHRLDYNILKNNVVFSESPTWKEFSGWYLKENINQATGKIESRQWAIQESTNELKNDGFGRSYAATSPVEDFADSVGFARFTPEDIEKVAPRKFAWITKNLFDGKSYTAEGIKNQYESFLKDFALNSLPALINSCVNNQSSFLYELDSNELSEYSDYDPGLVKCIFGGLKQSISKGLRILKANELQACGFLKNSESAVVRNVFINLREFIKKDLNQNIEIGIQLKALGEMISKVSEEIDPRELFIMCQEENVPMDCYNDKLLNSFNTISADYINQIPNQVNSYRETYQLDNRYSEVKGRIVSLFSQIFSGSDLRFKEEAKRKWKVCFKNNSAIESSNVLLTPFNGGTQFVHETLLNCLNSNAEAELMKVLDAVGKKISITIATQSTKKFIYDMYINSFTSYLQNNVALEAKNEEVHIKNIKNEVDKKVLTTMTSDTQWIGENTTDSSELEKLCLLEAGNISSQELSTQMSSKGVSYFFHNLSSHSSNEESCKKVLIQSNIKNVIYENQSKLVKNKIDSLKEIVLDLTKSPASKCRKQFSQNNKLIIKARNTCLTNFSKWKTITDSALSQWISDEKFETMAPARSVGSEYLQSIKTQLQDEAIKSMNL